MGDTTATRRELHHVEEALQVARVTLDQTREQLTGIEPVLDDALLDATAKEEHEHARATLRTVRGAADNVARALTELEHRAELLEAEWLAARRWTTEGLADLRGALDRLSENNSTAAAQQWVHEMLDAVRAGEWNALEAISELPLALPDKLIEGAQTVRQDVRRWLQGDDSAGVELCNALAEGRLPGWKDVLDAQTVSRVHRVAAWLALRRMNDAEKARQHLEQAVQLDSDRGLSYGDRAAFLLAMWDLTTAANDAQRAIELSPEDPVGYLYLGAWAEYSGEFAEARELYLRGFDKMPTHLIVMQPRRASLLDPPGGMLVAAAEALLGRRRSDGAVALLDAALAVGVPGRDTYPDAPVHALRSRALELEDLPKEAAAAAVEAGKRYHWSDNFPVAIEQLRRALELDPDAEEAGWYLADALIGSSVEPDVERPRPEPVRQAREVWETWHAKVGPPTEETSWAYLTRGIIAEKEWYIRESERSVARLEAIFYVEKALVHGGDDPYRWGFATRYFNYIGMPVTALEAAQRGIELGGTHETLLSERIALLANAGRFEEAVQALEEFVAWHGESPWGHGVHAWLVFHLARKDRGTLEFDDKQVESAIQLFDTAIEGGYDLPWCLDLRALCRLALKDVAGARKDMDAILEHRDPIDGWAKCRLAIAAAALGRDDQADNWLDIARQDEDSGAGLDEAEAYVSFVRGNVEEGARVLERAWAASSDPRELDDSVQNMLLRLRVLGTDEGSPPAEAVQRLAADARRRAELLAEEPTAEREFAAQLEGYDGPVRELPEAAIGLFAARARRQLEAQRFAEAEAEYAELVGSKFDPEAVLALERTLLAARDAALASADVGALRSVHARLAQLGASDDVQRSFDVSAALVASGLLDEAAGELEGVEQELDPARAIELERRRAEVAQARNDHGAAAAHLARALEVAQQAGDGVAAAQVELRLAFTEANAGHQDAAEKHMIAALRSWKSEDVYDVIWVMVEEVRSLVSSQSPGWDAAVASVRDLVARLYERGALQEFTASDADTIDQELESATTVPELHGISAG